MVISSTSSSVLVFLMLVFVTISLILNGCEGRSVSNGKETHLDDDRYDCVDIYKQPSLNHPLLKNHKIQMKPSLSRRRRGVKSLSNENESEKVVDLKIKCPIGTVPIPKMRQDDKTRASRSMSQIDNVEVFEHFGGIETTKKTNKTYHGATALMAVYKPTVNDNQMSGAMISLQSGGLAFSNKIKAGWMVNPHIYGDKETRFFTSWTADNYHRTGCYNALCPGIVIVNRAIPLDFVIHNVTVSGSPSKQFAMDIEIFQDEITSVWWLAVSYNKYDPIAYWPREIFTQLAANGGFEKIQMGGCVSEPVGKPSPPMGSGKYKRGLYTVSSYFAQINFVDESKNPIVPTDDLVTLILERCYFAGDNSFKEGILGYSFVFGGRGGDDYFCFQYKAM